jgi:hypothetical protein
LALSRKDWLQKRLPTLGFGHVDQRASAKRIEPAGQFLELLENQQSVQFHDIVPGGESRFCNIMRTRGYCVSADEVRTKARLTIIAPKTMLTVFLSVLGAIFINWLPLGRSSTVTTSVNTCSSRSLGFYAAGEICPLQDRSCILTMPHLLGQAGLRIVSRRTDSVMLLNLHTSLISVRATSFYSVI